MRCQPDEPFEQHEAHNDEAQKLISDDRRS